MARSDDPGPGTRPTRKKGIFTREGEYWTLGYGGKSFRLKDSKGVGYLAHLLRHPAVEFHVLDLVGGIAGQLGEDEINQLARGLPHGDDDLEKAGMLERSRDRCFQHGPVFCRLTQGAMAQQTAASTLLTRNGRFCYIFRNSSCKHAEFIEQ